MGISKNLFCKAENLSKEAKINVQEEIERLC